MTERFATEFNKINANFKAIFKELFGGGNGKLELDTSLSDDPLEAYGYDVRYALLLHGYTVKHVRLLHGGLTVRDHYKLILFALYGQEAGR